MKTLNLKQLFIATFAFMMIGIGAAQAQFLTRFDNWRPPSQEGINVFEAPKTDTIPFEGLKLRVGGDFALQFQSLEQENVADNLERLGGDFNLPTANLNLNLQLYDGMQMFLRTYLSSRNHPEAWVRGGYVQIDKLDFIKPGFLSGVMDVVRIKIGMDEINYGDWHFRRTDNAAALYNPFVGNYIMDAFTTEAFGEINVLPDNGFIGVLGFSNGKLNQSSVIDSAEDRSLSFYGKLGYDNRATDGLRFRLTGSWYINNGLNNGTYLYGGDRAGGRYYNVMVTETGARGDNFQPRFNPRFTQNRSFVINPFLAYEGLEFFGTYEIINNSDDGGGPDVEGGGSFTQIAADLIYRFGGNDQFYIGGRYNTVSGERAEGLPELEINRTNIGGGWFLTKNVLAKLEYVTSSYEGAGWTGSEFEGASFDGIVLEAAISF